MPRLPHRKGKTMKKTHNAKYEGRDKTRDRDGVKAARRKARKAKDKRRQFETGGGKGLR